MIRTMIIVVLVVVVMTAATPALAQPFPADTIHARIIWTSDRAVYINAGAEQGVEIGWRFRLGDTAYSDMVFGEQITDVYPEISSGLADSLLRNILARPDWYPPVVIYPDTARIPHIPHLRVGIVTDDPAPSTMIEICENPLLASLFHPEIRQTELGWSVDNRLDPAVRDVDTLMPPDTTCWSSRWIQHDGMTWIRNEQVPTTSLDRWRIDTIQHVHYRTHDDQAVGLELGEADLALLSISDLLRAGFPPDQYRLQRTTQKALVVFGVHQRKKHLQNNRLTTAVSYLISKEDVVEVLLAGQGAPRDDLLGFTQFAGASPYPYNPQQGYELLRKVKVRDPLWFAVDSRIDRGMIVARHVAEKLNLSGIETKIVEISPDRWYDPATLDSLDAFLYWLDIDAEDPGKSLIHLLESPFGQEVLASRETVFDDLREKPPAGDSLAVAAYYGTLEFKLLTEPYLCPLYQPIRSIAVARDLPDIRLTPYGEIDIVPQSR